MSRAPANRFIQGLEQVAERYDGFVIDQWGVLHDGQRAYDGAVACLERLSALGKAVIILTNSGRRAAANDARLQALGFARESYTAMISSGEIAWKVLKNRDDPFYGQLGRRCYLVSRGDDRSIIEGLDVQQVETVEEADFLLFAGRDEFESDESLEAVLDGGLKRKLPMICANPDRVMITPGGLMPGCATFAHRYEIRGGGPVRYIGKPYREIYTHCREACGGLAPERILAIGDSLEHDISGGAAVGFATAFVMNGIHAPAFASASDDATRAWRLHALEKEFDARPDWILPRLIW